MEAFIAIGISLLSLAVATLGYFSPRKPGGAVQGEISLGSDNLRGQIKHVGSGKARNLVIKTESSFPVEPIIRKISYPQDAYPIYAVRTMGRIQPAINITWRNMLRIRQERNYEL